MSFQASSSTTAQPSASTSNMVLPFRSYSQSNPIDLTLDDDDEDDFSDSYSDRRCKRPCSLGRNFDAASVDSHGEDRTSRPPSSGLSPAMSASSPLPPPPPYWGSQHYNGGPVPPIPNTIRPPPFTGPSDSSAFFQPRPRPAFMHPPRPELPPPIPRAAPNPLNFNTNDRQVIDLTNSPTPPPTACVSAQSTQGNLPSDLPPRTPVCIGQLSVTALVLYPITYLIAKEPSQGGGDADWAVVRLQHEQTPNKETVHIKAPSRRLSTGEPVQEENFAVVEQKVATVVGPMLGKGLIRIDAKVRRGMPNIPILPLQLIIWTPKGNIPVVANYLHQQGLFLDHPTLASDVQRLLKGYYFNPHNPPPGGFARAMVGQNGRIGYSGPGGSNVGRWNAPMVSGKSVEVQRSQVDELFKSLRDGDELVEADSPPEVATTLYPHQKKALTFLLEREREYGPNRRYSSLWQERFNPISGQCSWLHIVTQREIPQQPEETKGAILADDMGLGKTITCVSLIAATLRSAREFATVPLVPPASPPDSLESALSSAHFAGSVWGMPVAPEATSSRKQAKAAREHDREQALYARACRIKVRSRATLIICPLSTVVNWEDQFREHWRGEVQVVGGAGGSAPAPSTPLLGSGLSSLHAFPSSPQSSQGDATVDIKIPVGRIREGPPLRVYVYHGNARRPDPVFLADFDAVITTYSTLASEYSKQVKSTASVEDEDEDESDVDEGGLEVDERGNQILRLPRPKKAGAKKRKKLCGKANGSLEATSALQSVHWFRVVLDEAHSIKETSTVGCRASCDLVADRRLCLTGTPVQNKLDDVYALIKFLRIEPLDDKAVWTEFIGTPVKYGQPLGVARLQTIMKCITLRRTKESKAEDGRNILSLPPRRDELRYLKFDEQEQAIYDQFFTESKAEFHELSNKNEVMKNYVGILQKILRLRQICDHFELVQNKGLGLIGDIQSQDDAVSVEDLMALVAREGINGHRAGMIFSLLKEAGITQCVECGAELASPLDGIPGEGVLGEGDSGTGTPKRGGRKGKTPASRASTRQNSPAAPHIIMTRCQHLFCIGCFRNCISPSWPNISFEHSRCCSVCQTALTPTDAVEVVTDSPSLELASKRKPLKREKRQKGVIAMEDFHPSTKVRALLNDLVQFSKANPHSVNYDPTSIEVQMVDGEGNSLDDGIVKTVVFSQWTTMLDKIEDALEIAGIRYDRLDGTMKRDDRTRAMDALKHDPGCEVLLVSLKAGGVGLNLTAAQRVYLMDPYWNPAVENQAVDRIHRLGQTRPVTTVKLIIENSIEARLLEVQKKKTELANMTLGSNMSKAEMHARRLEELNQLFRN